MKFKLITLLKKILNKTIYNKLKKVYYLFKELKTQHYDLSKDLKYNEKLFKIFKFNLNKIKSTLNFFGYRYDDTSLSWHYHLFSGLKNYFKNKKINILEIGTHNGEFTKFIANIYKNCEISTLDLHEKDKLFISSYNREDKERLSKFLVLRNKNTERKNIHFIKLNSINIKKYFLNKKFDLIWIDGDHLNPQVTIDIINSIYLLKRNGIMCTDDVITSPKYKKINMFLVTVLIH